jgi:hypothetical protein
MIANRRAPLSVALGLAFAACGNANTSSTDAAMTMDASIPPPPTKIDLLFVVANGRDMAPQPQFLAQALPELLNGILNPACVDGNGMPVPTAQQPGPASPCPAGTSREFPLIQDVHIGVISSSLGSYGADACPDVDATSCPSGAPNTSNDDHGRLVNRIDPCAGGVVPTWNNRGYLAWDPTMSLGPPGERVIGDLNGPGLAKDLHDIIVGVGQRGCGFNGESEAWYRFLVDPSPFQSIALNGQSVMISGLDSALIDERSAFLRPDSLLVIIDVGVKTDGSLRHEGFYPLYAQRVSNGAPFHLPHPRSECATKGPDDPCCASCGVAPPSGCPVDPMCMTSGNYTDADENLALRAFGLESVKQRYGIEFFYQPSRYVQALTSPMIADANGATTANPIFAGGKRAPQDVIYAAIVGVPWQLVARQKNGMPDPVGGQSALDSKTTGGFKTSAELSLKDAQGNTFWDDLVGDPEHHVPPLSPLMQESTVPRSGVDPITGIAIAPPTAGAGANAANGHEYVIPSPPGDIEYACVFPLPAPVDCSVPGTVCECTGDAAAMNPLCAPNPKDNARPTLQINGRAYPGLKQLVIARGLGAQGVVASTCVKQASDPTQADYGYRPSVKTIVDRVKTALTR